MLTRTTLPSFSLALATLLLMASAAQAAGGRILAKPPSATATPTTGGPPLDGGTIYYGQLDSSTGIRTAHAIEPDGTNDTIIGTVTEAYLRPSRELHNGARWYVAPRIVSGTTGFFPGGAVDGQLVELDVWREGSPPIQITDNAGACIQVYGGEGVRWGWSPDASGQADGAISWLGTRWTDLGNNGSCDQPADGGIFRGQVAIDGSNNVTFGQPTLAEVAVALGTSGLTRAAEFSWSPDGQQVAYKDTSGEDLWVASGASRTMIFNGITEDLDWSPDRDPNTAGYQTRIAFTGRVIGSNGAETERGTYTIAPNGTGRLRIATAKTQKGGNPTWSAHYNVFWSPTGSHVTYLQVFIDTTSTRTLRRVNADGSGDTVLVTAVTGVSSIYGLGWAAD